MYKPLKKSYNSDMNDLVEDLVKGGPGSGKRGHKTQGKETMQSLQNQMKHLIRDSNPKTSSAAQVNSANKKIGELEEKIKSSNLKRRYTTEMYVI